MSGDWQHMDTAPKNATEVEVLTRDDKIVVAHWASDLSGEEQPPFRGWFVRKASYFGEIETPKEWRPLK
jgi:hypothetical protein